MKDVKGRNIDYMRISITHDRDEAFQLCDQILGYYSAFQLSLCTYSCLEKHLI